MDKSKAHDIVHQWNGGKSDNCPHCQGTMDEKAMKSEASKIAQENYKPRVNPQTSYDNRLMTYADHDGNMPEVITNEENLNLRRIDSDIRPMIDVVAFGEGKEELPTKIKVLPYGKYKMNRYGEVEINKTKADDMVKHFDENVRASSSTAGLPIDIEHGTTSYKDAAAGWLKKLFAEKDGLYAEVEWTTLGKKLLKERLYKFYSPEFWFDYQDAENIDIKLNNVMTGGGLVNKPMLKHDLKPLVNSEGQNENTPLTENKNTSTIFLELTKTEQETSSDKTMTLSEIVKKAKADRTADEAKFLLDHKDELTFAEAKTEGLAQEKVETKNENTNQISLSEGQRVVDGKQFDALVALAERGASADEKLKKAELKDKIKQATFSETGVKLPTDQLDKWTERLFKMSETDQNEAIEDLKALPEKQIFGEVGSNAKGSNNAAADDLAKQIQTYMEEHKGVGYAEAAIAVSSANPTQFNEYKDNRPVAGVER